MLPVSRCRKNLDLPIITDIAEPEKTNEPEPASDTAEDRPSEAEHDCFIVTDRARRKHGLPLLTPEDLIEVIDTPILQPKKEISMLKTAKPKNLMMKVKNVELEKAIAKKKRAQLLAAAKKQKPQEDETIKYALSKEQMEQIHDTFKLYDRDMDGYITGKEMCEVIVGLARMPPKDMILKCKIGFEEFAYRFAELLKEVNPEEEIREALQVFDKKDTNFVSMNELRHALTIMGDRLTDHEVDLLFENLDRDKNNMVLLEDVVGTIAPEIIDGEEELSEHKEEWNADNEKPEMVELQYEPTNGPKRVDKGV